MHRARHRASGNQVALKHMFLQEDGLLPLHIRRELQLLRSVQHPSLVTLLDVKQEVMPPVCALARMGWHVLMD